MASFVLARNVTRQHTTFGGAGFGALSPNLLSPSGRWNPDELSQAINELAERLHDQSPDGELLPRDMVFVSVKSTLKRYLKARNLSVDEALQMIEETKTYKKEHNFETILEEPLNDEDLEFIVSRYPGCYCGYDREGHPIYYENSPAVQWIEILEKYGKEYCVRLHHKLMEFQGRILLARATERNGYVLRDKFINVLDMDGLSLSVLMDKRIQEIVKEVSASDSIIYPELLRRAYIVNAPFAFKAAWAIIRPFLPKSTQDKVKILGYGVKSIDAVKSALGEDASLPASIYHGARGAPKVEEEKPHENAIKVCNEYMKSRLKLNSSNKLIKETEKISDLAPSDEGVKRIHDETDDQAVDDAYADLEKRGIRPAEAARLVGALKDASQTDAAQQLWKDDGFQEKKPKMHPIKKSPEEMRIDVTSLMGHIKHVSLLFFFYGGLVLMRCLVEIAVGGADRDLKQSFGITDGITHAIYSILLYRFSGKFLKGYYLRRQDTWNDDISTLADMFQQMRSFFLLIAAINFIPLVASWFGFQ